MVILGRNQDVMKTIVIMIFISFVFLSLFGQDEARREKLKRDTVGIRIQKNYKGFPNERAIIPELKPFGRLDPQNDYGEYDSIVAERYPGAERYYSRKPYLEEFTYRKSFIFEPDLHEKHFLIIKDPIRNIVRK